MKHTYKIYFSIFLLASISFVQCKKVKEDSAPVEDANGRKFGWTGTDNPATIPSFLTTFGNSSTALPTSYDLSQYLPPIGFQNPYGTCVAWAVAYNAKTATEAISKNLSSSDLGQSKNQLSPKDLFTAISDNYKGPNCEGTNIASACDVLLSRGVATMETVPYTGLSNCNQSLVQSSWTANANSHKIKYYRKINQDVLSIKKNIANKIPIMFGAQVYSNFENIRSEAVLASNSGALLGGHAMTLVGYDDTRGPNGAFKVVNSWSTGWGASGFFWIDYNFFVNQFCTPGNMYIMANADGSGAPSAPNAGVDLSPWVFSDISNQPNTGIANQRVLKFNIYNIGSVAASPSSNWEFHYIYYNAYNANDYGILYTDKFNTTVAANSYSCTSATNCNFNYSIPAGSDFATIVFNNNSITRTYSVPTTLNGSYYLVLLADATGKINEQNEQNNIFYTTPQSPKVFTNGYSSRSNANVYDQLNFVNTLVPTKENLQKNVNHSAVNNNNRNAYTPEEIMEFIKEKKKTGELDIKVNEFKSGEVNKNLIYTK